MQITVDIPDGSDELEELLDCVADNNQAVDIHNRDNPQNQKNHITEQEYVNNIIKGWLTNRVMETYVHHVRKQTTQALRGTLGHAKNLKE